MALNSAHHHEVFFASWWAGAVANPINTRWSAAEIAYALTDSGTEVLFVDDAFAHFGPELRERAPGLRTLIYCGAGPTPEACSPTRNWSPARHRFPTSIEAATSWRCCSTPAAPPANPRA